MQLTAGIILLLLVSSASCSSPFAKAEASSPSPNDNQPQTPASSPPKPCARQLANPSRYLHPVAFSDSRCLFVLRRASWKSNPKINDTHLRFDAARARELCHSEGATMPRLRTDEEIKAFDGFVKTVQSTKADGLAMEDGSFVALAIYRAAMGLAWDDRSGFLDTKAINRIMNLPDKIDENTYFVASLSKISSEWLWFPNDAVHSKPVAVFCETTESFAPVHPSVECERMSQKPDSEYDWSSYLNESGSCFFIVKDSFNQSNIQTVDGKIKFDIDGARKICANHGAVLPILKRLDDQDRLQKRLNGATRFVLGLNRSTTNSHCQQPLPETGSKPVDPNNRFCYSWDDGSEADNDFQATWPTKFVESSFTYVDFESDRWVNAPIDGIVESPISVVCQEVLEPRQQHLKTEAVWSNKCLRGKHDDYDNTGVFNKTHCYFTKYSSFKDSNRGSLKTGYVFSLAKAIEACKNEGATLPILEGYSEESREAEAQFIATTFLKISKVALSLRQISHPRDWWWHSNVSLANQTFNDTSTLETNQYVAFTTINESLIWQHHDGSRMKSPIRVLCKPSNSESNLGWCIGPKKAEILIRSRYESSVCYFAVENATRNVNQIKDGKYLFKFEKALELCHSYNGTLATANDPGRIGHLVDMIHFNATIRAEVVLGLNQTMDGNRYTYTWNDGTPSEFYFQPIWPTKFDQAAYTKMSMINLGSESHVTWVNVPNAIWSDRPVYVICQQPVPTLDAPKAPLAPHGVLAGKRFSGVFFHHPTFYNFLACYFVIPGATTAANQRTEIEEEGGNKSTSIRFSMTTAREKCHAEGGTLVTPTFGSAETYDKEYQFIATNFGPEVFAKSDHSLLSGPVEYVALGLSQLDSPGTYQWDGSDAFTRPSWQWTDENAYAYMTVMSLSPSNMSYVNFQTDLVNSTIGVLCKYTVEREEEPNVVTYHRETDFVPITYHKNKEETSAPATTIGDPVQQKRTTEWDPYGGDGKGTNVPMQYWAVAMVGVLAMRWY